MLLGNVYGADHYGADHYADETLLHAHAPPPPPQEGPLGPAVGGRGEGSGVRASLSERLRGSVSRDRAPTGISGAYRSMHHPPPPPAPPVPAAPPPASMWPEQPPRESPGEFATCVADVVCSYLWRVLPQRAAAAATAARHGRQQREPLIASLRFCVETDSAGSPLIPEPLRQIELWCMLAGWGLVHVGSVPISYDRRFRCTFPEIHEAVLHRVPHIGTPAEAAGPVGYLVSLAIKEERRVLAVVDELLARHVPGLA